jgi:hypothetical protein
MKTDNTIEAKKTLIAIQYNSIIHKAAKTSIKGILTFMLNAVVAFVLLIGNSSFTLLTYGQGVDSAKIVSFEESTENTDKKEVKISIPTRNMIRRADIEINRNMNEWIKMINLFRIPRFDPFNADKQINNNFLESFYLNFNVSDADEDRLHTLFQSENIKFGGMKPFLESDFIIDNIFKSASYINHNNAIIVEADLIITSTFHAENP